MNLKVAVNWVHLTWVLSALSVQLHLIGLLLVKVVQTLGDDQD